MLARMVDGIEINFCEACEALWLDALELKKFESYLKDPDRIPAFRPVATGNLGEDVYSDYGVFAGLGDFFLGFMDLFSGW
ncbi:MAG: zf-TFIIB domain-containing protein [Fibrobacteres bacterium]|nr:zf-TFIIB domain-containing protein [Fibrobacterota bacterium]